MPKYNQPRKTWQYSNEFKAKAVQLSLIEGIQVQMTTWTVIVREKALVACSNFSRLIK